MSICVERHDPDKRPPAVGVIESPWSEERLERWTLATADFLEALSRVAPETAAELKREARCTPRRSHPRGSRLGDGG